MLWDMVVGHGSLPLLLRFTLCLASSSSTLHFQRLKSSAQLGYVQGFAVLTPPSHIARIIERVGFCSNRRRFQELPVNISKRRGLSTQVNHGALTGGVGTLTPLLITIMGEIVGEVSGLVCL